MMYEHMGVKETPRPHLGIQRILTLTDYGSIRFLIPIHPDDLHILMDQHTRHWRAGMRVGLIMGFMVAAALMVAFLAVTS